MHPTDADPDPISTSTIEFLRVRVLTGLTGREKGAPDTVEDEKPAEGRTIDMTDADGTSRARARRGRGTLVAVLAGVGALIIVGGALALMALMGDDSSGEADLLVVADDQVRLTEHVTLRDLPEWADRVEQPESTLDGDAAEIIAVQDSFSGLRHTMFEVLDTTGTRRIRVYVVEGLPFDPALSATVLGPIGTVDGDTAVVDLPDRDTLQGSPVDGLLIQLEGDSLDELHTVFDGVEAGADDEQLPGDPIVLTSGMSNDLPWTITVTRAAVGASIATDPDGHCVRARTYHSQSSCARPFEDRVIRAMRFEPLIAGTDPDLAGIRTDGDVAAVVARHRKGGEERADTIDLAPAAGRMSIVGWPNDDPVVEVDLLDANGELIRTIDEING